MGLKQGFMLQKAMTIDAMRGWSSGGGCKVYFKFGNLPEALCHLFGELVGKFTSSRERLQRLPS